MMDFKDSEIKRILAYSTVSQLGYMMLALGVGSLTASMFHLMTHAFFKALLFLGAGSVIIGMHHDQDIRHMGGLRKYMPITWVTSLIGSLALVGTPFFSGFYSKDSIIEAAKYSTLPGSSFAYFAVLASVFVTAFYAFRQYFMVFHGEEKWRSLHEHHDETASAMKTIEPNDLWAFFASHIQELIESRLDGSATATARDVVAQHFALASTAHMAQWMLSGLEVNPSLAIARMRVLMTDQTTPALARLAQ